MFFQALKLLRRKAHIFYASSTQTGRESSWNAYLETAVFHDKNAASPTGKYDVLELLEQARCLEGCLTSLATSLRKAGFWRTFYRPASNQCMALLRPWQPASFQGR